MVSPQGGPVAAGGPDRGQAFPELIKAYIPQDLPAKAGGHLAHLLGDGGIVGGEIGVAGPGVDDAQGVAKAAEIHLHPPQIRVVGILEVNDDHAAGGTGHLVHEAAGLAEVDIFRVLPYLGKLCGGEGPAAEKLVHDGGGKNLKGGGGAQTAAPEDPGGGVGVESPHGIAQLSKPGGHPTKKGDRVAGLLFFHGEVRKIHLRQAVMAGFDADGLAVVGYHAGNGVQVDAGGQAVAVLMVGVVAAQLCPAGGGKEQSFRVIAARKGFSVLQHQFPQAIGGAGRVLAVDRLQPLRQTALFQFTQQFPSSHGRCPPSFCI